MKDVDLQTRLIDHLDILVRRYKTFPQAITAKQAAEAVGGSYTRVGMIASSVVDELKARGIEVKYTQTPAPSAKVFIFYSVSHSSR